MSKTDGLASFDSFNGKISLLTAATPGSLAYRRWKKRS